MKLYWTEIAWEDYLFWQANDKLPISLKVAARYNPKLQLSAIESCRCLQ